MLIQRLTYLCVLLFAAQVFSQTENLFRSNTIPVELLSNANAVVRLDKTITTIEDFDDVTIKVKRIVTIFNEHGITKAGAYVHYDSNKSIKQLEARIYDSNGEEIKKFKKSDFLDESAVDGGTLYSDSRVKYLRYTPIAYPYTVEFDLVLQLRSTAFLPNWSPIDGYYTSTEKSEFIIINKSAVTVKLKPSNFDGYPIENKGDKHFIASEIPALKPEDFSPSLDSTTPDLKVAMTTFNMEGVPGVNNTWTDFGKWYNEELLHGTDILPESVKTEIRKRTWGMEDPLEKAKIVYNFVQEKTRYISVQVGIGGWKPFNAEDVDRLGYSDCKGLTNYTKALLDVVGVESHFVLLYGGREIKNIDSDFSMPNGNHAILNIPTQDDNVWLECTSQTNPFGHIAGFTDDRDVLVITSQGGKIVHTRSYSAEENLQHTVADITIRPDASLEGDVKVNTYGYQYSLHRDRQFLPHKEQELSLKNYWDNIHNLKLKEFKFEDDKDQVKFSETAKISADGYATKTGNMLLFQPNAFNKVENIPTRYSERTQDFEIDRGFVDKDEFTINIPEGLMIEALPNDVKIETKFGSYEFTITKISDNGLLYKRQYSLNKGYYAKDEYEDFRAFMAEVVKSDKSKIALKTK